MGRRLIHESSHDATVLRTRLTEMAGQAARINVRYPDNMAFFQIVAKFLCLPEITRTQR